jgi:hypothetical protein
MSCVVCVLGGGEVSEVSEVSEDGDVEDMRDNGHGACVWCGVVARG